MEVRHLKFYLTFILLIYVTGLFAQKKVLFIGNSHTYVNDLPLVFKVIADSKGDEVSVRQSAEGGYKLFEHAEYQPTLEAISEEAWDYVVLQEGIYSSLPVYQASQQSYPFAQELYNKIKENSEDTEVIIYMVQSYKYGTTYRCQEDPVVCTYEGMYGRVKENNINIGRMLNSTVAPCGMVWDKMMDVDNTLDYYFTDNYHPSILGTYISASTIYATIFQKDLSGAYLPDEVSASTKTQIDDIIKQQVLDLNSEWYQDVYLLPASGAVYRNDIDLYPNPATTFISLQSDRNIEAVSCEIIDIRGKMIARQAIRKNVIDVQHLPKGMYILQLNTENEKFRKKIIIN